VDTLTPPREHIALRPPGSQTIEGRSVFVISDLSIDQVRLWAQLNKRLKPFHDSGIDMLQFRLESTGGRWPRFTIYVDGIKIKLSDRSTIDAPRARTMITSMTTQLEAYVAALRAQLPMMTRTQIQKGDMHVHLTWKITEPARIEFQNSHVRIVHGIHIQWPNEIKDFCRKETISWIGLEI
jgi:hypothetical protein